MEGHQNLAASSSQAQPALLLPSIEVEEDADMPATEAQDMLCFPAATCYVCNQPGNTDRLMTCLSAPVYRRLTAGCNQESIHLAAAASDSLLSQFLQPGKPGTVARQIEGAKHCQKHFHQTCLGRRKEAVFDNRVTVVKKLKDDAQETRVKDLRHRLCGECLQLEQGSQETKYTGSLDGVSCWSCLLCAWQLTVSVCQLAGLHESDSTFWSHPLCTCWDICNMVCAGSQVGKQAAVHSVPTRC